MCPRERRREGEGGLEREQGEEGEEDQEGGAHNHHHKRRNSSSSSSSRCLELATQPQQRHLHQEVSLQSGPLHGRVRGRTQQPSRSQQAKPLGLGAVRMVVAVTPALRQEQK